ncbi:hypothetical protein BDK51DRAFT_25507, partial [Blyttiomyces helicus]
MDEPEYAEWNMLILEIFYWTFLGRDPVELINRDMESRELAVKLQEEIKQKKREPRIVSSRHARFGGTLSLKLADGKHFHVHNTTTGILSAEIALDNNKKGQPARKKMQTDDPELNFWRLKDEISRKRAIVNLEAKVIYTNTAKAFLENGFNALFLCVKKDFDMERSSVYLFIHLVLARRPYNAGPDIIFREQGAKPEPRLDFDTVGGIMDLRGLLFVFKRIRLCTDEKRWTELHIAVDCLKAIMITMDAMMVSENEEYREVSDHMQNNFYYEQSTLDLIVGLVRNHKYESLSYLKSLIETVHILMKMLERYSKSKPVMFSRKKKKGGRRKKKDKEQGRGFSRKPLLRLLRGRNPEEEAPASEEDEPAPQRTGADNEA